jgi:opacity protein-like surface antigen
MLRRIRDFAGVLLALACLAPSAHAAELYLNGTFMQSLGRDNSSGEIQDNVARVLGSDGDSSLGYGLALGFGFEFAEVLPKKWDAWGTAFRIEGEFVYGREYEFVSNTEDPITGDPLPRKFFDEVKAWTVMPINLYIDVPGVSHVHINAFDNTGNARDTVYKFAFQANTALSYEINERTKIQFGYRYLDLGATDADLEFNGTNVEIGTLELDLKSHEIVLAARWAFDQKPLSEMDIPMPRWLGGDGWWGDDQPERQKPKKPTKKRRWWPTWLGGKRGP